MLWIWPGIHGRAVEVGADQVVDRRIGVGDMAVELGLGDRIGEEREGDRVGIARLGLEPREIDRAAVEPRRRAGLEPLELKSEREEAFRQPDRGARRRRGRRRS